LDESHPSLSIRLGPQQSANVKAPCNAGPGHFPVDIFPPDIFPCPDISPPGQFPSFLHGEGHFPLPPLPSANIQYKAIYR